MQQHFDKQISLLMGRMDLLEKVIQFLAEIVVKKWILAIQQELELLKGENVDVSKAEPEISEAAKSKEVPNEAEVSRDEPVKKKRKRNSSGNAIPGKARTQNHRQNLNEVQVDTRRISNRNSKKAPILKNTELAKDCKSIPEKFKFTSGSFSQSNDRFDFAPACLGNVLVALCYPKDPRRWKTSDVNRILDLGHDNYQLMIQRGGIAANSELNEGALNLLNQRIKIERSTAHFEVIEPCAEGEVEYMQDEFGFFCDIQTAIQRIFSKNDRAMLLAERKWYAVMRMDEGQFAIFNSHSVNTMNEPWEGGTAKVFFAESVEQAIEVLMGSFSAGKKTAFQLFGLKVAFTEES